MAMGRTVDQQGYQNDEELPFGMGEPGAVEPPPPGLPDNIDLSGAPSTGGDIGTPDVQRVQGRESGAERASGSGTSMSFATPSGAGPDVQRVGAQATPSMPTSPSPAAMGAPQPFTPIASGATPSAMAGVQRVSMNSPLFGRAGGLLGGGVGIQHGNALEAETNPDVQRLLQMLGVK